MKEYYTQPQDGTRYTIERAERAAHFFVRYGIDTAGHAACTSGPFDTLEEARATLQKHRPGAVLTNSPR